jgi:hypothetical protein
VIEKAMSGHFAYFKLVIDLVDGKIRRTAAHEMTADTASTLVVACESLPVARAHAA